MLSQQQIDIIIETMKPYNPKKIGIFGSYARGENSPKSDVDILYRFEEPVGLFTLAGIQEMLENSLDIEVDLISEKYIHPYLKQNILADLKVIYERKLKKMTFG